MTADWTGPDNANNSAVIWDSIITNPSADHLQNLGPVAMKKLKRSAEGKSTAPERYVCPHKDKDTPSTSDVV